MEFFIGISEIQKALKVMGTVAKANADDASGYVLIGASDDNSIIFVGYNPKLSVTHKANDCDIKSPGKVCLPFSKLMSFVNSFPSWDGSSGVENVHIKKLKHGVSVKLINTFENGKQAKNKLNLKMFPHQNFFIPEPFKKTTFEMNAPVLKLAISKVVYAIDPNASQSFIQGMNINFDKDNIYFAGTNALKLSEYRTKNTGGLVDKSIVVHYLFLMALRKILDPNKKVYFEISDTKIKVIVNTTTLHSNLIVDMPYPDYTVTFSKYKHQVVLDKDIMLASFIPYLGILSDEDNKRLTIELKDSKLSIYSDFSESTYEGDIGYAGNFVIDINGSFLAQTLDAINDDIIEMRFSDADGFLIFDSANFHDQRALITPIKRR